MGKKAAHYIRYHDTLHLLTTAYDLVEQKSFDDAKHNLCKACRLLQRGLIEEMKKGNRK